MGISFTPAAPWFSTARAPGTTSVRISESSGSSEASAQPLGTLLGPSAGGAGGFAADAAGRAEGGASSAGGPSMYSRSRVSTVRESSGASSRIVWQLAIASSTRPWSTCSSRARRSAASSPIASAWARNKRAVRRGQAGSPGSSRSRRESALSAPPIRFALRCWASRCFNCSTEGIMDPSPTSEVGRSGGADPIGGVTSRAGD